jgi:hypothetical protein
MAAGLGASASSDMPDAICKSFLLLFFKKEESFLFCRRFAAAKETC